MSPSKTSKTPAASSDVTPEQAMKAVEKALTELGYFGGGQRRQALTVTGQRLYKALTELQAAEAHAAELRAGMGTLVSEALQAVAGTLPLKAVAKPTTDTTTDTTANGTGGVQ
jgi:hypothetical protein